MLEPFPFGSLLHEFKQPLAGEFGVDLGYFQMSGFVSASVLHLLKQLGLVDKQTVIGVRFFLLEREDAPVSQLGLNHEQYFAGLLSLQLLQLFRGQVPDSECDLLDGFRVESVVLNETEDVLLADCFVDGAQFLGRFLLAAQLHRPVLPLLYLHLGVNNVCGVQHCAGPSLHALNLGQHRPCFCASQFDGLATGVDKFFAAGLLQFFHRLHNAVTLVASVGYRVFLTARQPVFVAFIGCWRLCIDDKTDSLVSGEGSEAFEEIFAL